jgi:hypothetical protein
MYLQFFTKGLRLGDIWCRLFHRRINRGYYGHYTCMVCQRQYHTNY